jgi:hypothetical protein
MINVADDIVPVLGTEDGWNKFYELIESAGTSERAVYAERIVVGYSSSYTTPFYEQIGSRTNANSMYDRKVLSN